LGTLSQTRGLDVSPIVELNRIGIPSVAIPTSVPFAEISKGNVKVAGLRDRCYVDHMGLG